MRNAVGLILIALVMMAGCDAPETSQNPKIKGNGVVKEEKRDLPGFTGIEIVAAFEATVTLGEKPSITLQSEENLLPLVQTEVEGGRLFVKFAPGQSIETTHPQKATIVVPSLDFISGRGAARITTTVGESKSFRIEAEGASVISVNGLSTEQLDVQCDGACQVTLVGKAKNATIRLSGASKIMAEKATIESAKVEFGGACGGELFVTDSVTGLVAGASSLTIKGEPKSRSIKTLGASSISY
jgi:hypothetical protein